MLCSCGNHLDFILFIIMTKQFDFFTDNNDYQNVFSLPLLKNSSSDWF